MGKVLVIIIVGLVLWDFLQNDAHIFAMLNYYVERMLEFFHLA